MNKICLLIIGLFLSYCSALSQSPVSSGMGGAGVAFLKGAHALSHNPAGAVASDDSARIEIVLLRVNASQFNDSGFALEDYNTVDGYLSDSQKENMLDNFPNTAAVNPAANITPVAFIFRDFSENIGVFGFSVEDVFKGNADVPKDILRFVLYGNIPGTNFDLGKFGGEFMHYRSFGLTWAKSLGKLSVGVTGRYIQGLEYVSADFEDSYLYTDDNHHISINLASHAVVSGTSKYESAHFPVATYLFTGKSAGTGFGADIGMHYKVDEKISVGLALRNLGVISWGRENTDEYEMQTDGTIVEVTDGDHIESIFENAEYKEIPSSSFNTSTDPKVTAGASYSLTGPLVPGDEILFAAETNILFGEPLSPETEYMFSGGVKWNIRTYLPVIMAGYSRTYGNSDFISAGLGYSGDVFDIYLSVQDILAGFSSEPEGSISFGMRVLL